jgi:hypothetical protein
VKHFTKPENNSSGRLQRRVLARQYRTTQKALVVRHIRTGLKICLAAASAPSYRMSVARGRPWRSMSSAKLYRSPNCGAVSFCQNAASPQNPKWRSSNQVGHGLDLGFVSFTAPEKT